MSTNRVTELDAEIVQARTAKGYLVDLQDKAASLPGLEREQHLLERQEKASLEMGQVQDAVKVTVDEVEPLLASWRGDFAKLVIQLADLCERLAPIDGSLHAAVSALKRAVQSERRALGDLDAGSVKNLYNASLQMAQRYGELATSLGLFDETLSPFPPITDALVGALAQAITSRVRVFDPGVIKAQGFR